MEVKCLISVQVKSFKGVYNSVCYSVYLFSIFRGGECDDERGEGNPEIKRITSIQDII